MYDTYTSLSPQRPYPPDNHALSFVSHSKTNSVHQHRKSVSSSKTRRYESPIPIPQSLTQNFASNVKNTCRGALAWNASWRPFGSLLANAVRLEA